MTAFVKVIQVEEYHQHIPLSLKDQQIGHIHSKFNNGFNIKMGEKLLFIGTVKNGQLPFGIHVSYQHMQELLSEVDRHSIFVWQEDEQQIRCLTESFSIQLKGGNSFDHPLPQVNSSRMLNYVTDVLTVLLETNEPTGFGLMIETYMFDYVQDKLPKSKVEQQLNTLIESVFSDDRQKTEDVLRYFIGRGKGLTPSGDDLLVGMLSIHVACEFCSTVFMDVLQDLITNESLTTDVAKEYLCFAVKGSFSSSVVAIINDIKQENKSTLAIHLRELLEMGHSSGIDTAFGMLIGMLALRRQHLWEKR